MRLGEIAALLQEVFVSSDQRYQNFLASYGYEKEEVNERFGKVIRNRAQRVHRYGYKPRTVKIPSRDAVEKLIEEGRFKEEECKLYPNFW